MKAKEVTKATVRSASLGPSGKPSAAPPSQMPAVPSDKGRPRRDKDHNYSPRKAG